MKGRLSLGNKTNGEGETIFFMMCLSTLFYCTHVIVCMSYNTTDRLIFQGSSLQSADMTALVNKLINN